MSRQPTPRAPVPSAFITASLAAKRAASSGTRPRQWRTSSSVYTRRRKRSPCRSSAARTRAISMMSMPWANVRATPPILAARPSPRQPRRLAP